MATKEKKPAADAAAKEKLEKPKPEQPADTGKRLPATSKVTFQGHDQRL